MCDQPNNKCCTVVSIGQLVNASSDIEYKSIEDDVNEIDYGMKLCSHCVHDLFVIRKYQKDIERKPSLLLRKYELLDNLSRVISDILPNFQNLLESLDRSKKDGNILNSEDLTALSQLRSKLLKSFVLYNETAKILSKIEPQNNSERKIQESIRQVSSKFINETLLPLKSVPDILNPKTESNIEDDTPEVTTLSELMKNDLSIKEINNAREELMVLKEQVYLVENMIEKAKKQRKFDEISILTDNLQDLNSQIQTIETKLGDLSFT
ncbi:hypothetical protein Kpol_364p1 [Vanderwaltozyma polyspora DSM 70294]|uniref:Rabenosyn Rab binding domain-containing protein n=1 Tax=Vanderwaltozyma polyspora (strain ATCC 22028 / DSM 70294 / BCRC 21397 / CBS 2163 / NBRC 10782 / NRRL Y-8283 / UCD 57-17) TaxID=436907 RepID=A7TSB7_VANPO|nr:uncharacterized protein Kpol_364p1 [Vanderwaltozyma polyspora DSM 70294]EDO14829.1 hypothetical protein Kpol_364p1 [Vanderwaltozyma polyspora DSM 70294]